MFQKIFSVFLTVLVSVVVVAVVVQAATTISTNISTGGTLSVTGISTLGNNVTIPAAYSLDTAAAGALNLGTTTATSVIVGSASAKVGIASTSPYVALGVTGTTTSSLGVVIGALGSGISQVLFGTCSVDLPSINATTTAVANCAATGVTAGTSVFITPNSLPSFVVFTGASSTASDVIQVAAFNIGNQSGAGAAVNPAAATWSWMAIK